MVQLLEELSGFGDGHVGLVRQGVTTVEEVLSVTTAKEVASATKGDSEDDTSPADLAVTRD